MAVADLDVLRSRGGGGGGGRYHTTSQRYIPTCSHLMNAGSPCFMPCLLIIVGQVALDD